MGINPASAKYGISTGSVDTPALLTAELKTSTGQKLNYYTDEAFQSFSKPWKVYLTSNSTQDQHDACSPLPSSTPNLEDYVVLIRRGSVDERLRCEFWLMFDQWTLIVIFFTHSRSCFFVDKVAHAKSKGAKMILIYMVSTLTIFHHLLSFSLSLLLHSLTYLINSQNSTEIITLATEINNTRVAVLNKEDGEYIFKQSKKHPKRFTLSFPKGLMKFGMSRNYIYIYMNMGAWTCRPYTDEEIHISLHSPSSRWVRK